MRSTFDCRSTDADPPWRSVCLFISHHWLSIYTREQFSSLKDFAGVRGCSGTHVSISHRLILPQGFVSKELSAGQDVSRGPALLRVYTHIVGGLRVSFDSSRRMAMGWVGVL